jgi:hypothetical protein
MRVALLTSLRATKKEPLAEALRRLAAAFVESGPAPDARFLLADAPVPGFVSTVDRVLRRFRELSATLHEAPLVPGSPATRCLTNRLESPNAGQAVPFETLAAIAAGVPRSFPAHVIRIWLSRPDFGEPAGVAAGMLVPGLLLGDAWWVNGRTRSLDATVIVDVEAAGGALPPLPASVRAVLAAAGKPSKTVQLPLAEPGDARAPLGVARPRPEAAEAVAAVILEYRRRLDDVLDGVAFPHDLPPRAEALAALRFEVSGPRKEALVEAFKPMGYDCKGGGGMFHLRRRTSGNLTLEIELDVGTWSNMVTGFYHVQGLGFSATLPLPVGPRTGSGQYPIGDAVRWRQIVANLAAAVTEYERSFVPAVEAAAGPSPAWYRPES